MPTSDDLIELADQCAEKLAELNREGRTIIFMSHDLELVKSVCSTGMWLDKGHVQLRGDIGEVAAAYAEVAAAERA